MAVSDQKSAVTNNTIAHRTEAGEKDEQSLLKDRRNGIIEIRRLGEIPKFLDNLGRVLRGHLDQVIHHRV